MPAVYISRQPVVNRQSKIIANRLTLHCQGGATSSDVLAMLDTLAELWPQGEKQIFVNLSGAPVDAALLAWQAPGNATLEIPSSVLAGPQGSELKAAA